jgi:hypothetical protein
MSHVDRNDNHHPIRVANADCRGTLFSRCGSGDINNILRHFDATGVIQLIRVVRNQKMLAALGVWSLGGYWRRREVTECTLCAQARPQSKTERNQTIHVIRARRVASASGKRSSRNPPRKLDNLGRSPTGASCAGRAKSLVLKKKSMFSLSKASSSRLTLRPDVDSTVTRQMGFGLISA